MKTLKNTIKALKTHLEEPSLKCKINSIIKKNSRFSIYFFRNDKGQNTSMKLILFKGTIETKNDLFHD